MGAEMLKGMNGQAIRSEGTGTAAIPNGLSDEIIGKKGDVFV